MGRNSGFIRIYLIEEDNKNLLSSTPLYSEIQVLSFWLKFKGSIKPTSYLMELFDQDGKLLMGKRIPKKEALDAISIIHKMLIQRL